MCRIPTTISLAYDLAVCLRFIYDSVHLSFLIISQLPLFQLV